MTLLDAVQYTAESIVTIAYVWCVGMVLIGGAKVVGWLLRSAWRMRP